MNRRIFLLYQGIALTSVAAFNFGCSIKTLVDKKSDRIALIYGTRYGAHKRLIELLSRHKEQIQSKIIASFIVCGTTGEDEAGKRRIEIYFEKFHKPLDSKPLLQRYFGGRMIIEKLNKGHL